MQTTVGPKRLRDKNGNIYVISVDGTVSMQTTADQKKDKWRKIGRFDRETGIFWKNEKYNPDTIYYRFSSFGFPYYLLRHLYEKEGLRKIIVIVSHWKQYEIEAEKVLDKEKRLSQIEIRDYKNKGYELRIYIPIKYFKKIEK